MTTTTTKADPPHNWTALFPEPGPKPEPPPEQHPEPGDLQALRAYHTQLHQWNAWIRRNRLYILAMSLDALEAKQAALIAASPDGASKMEAVERICMVLATACLQETAEAMRAPTSLLDLLARLA